MRLTSLFRHHPAKRSRANTTRPQVQPLEARLPPGDALLAGLLANIWLGARLPLLEDPQSAAQSAEQFPWLAAAACPFASASGFNNGLKPEALAKEPGQTDESGPAERVQTNESGLSAAPFANSASSFQRDVASPAPAEPQTAATFPVSFAAPGSRGDVSAGVFALTLANYYLLDQAAAMVGLRTTAEADLDPDAATRAAGVHALFDLGQPTTGPFPSNVFTVPDETHNTGRRVNMPFPDCTVYVTDCQDLAVINTLDGFNLQARLSVPFDGPIDVQTVSSSTVFVVSLGSTLDHGYAPRGTVVGIDQTVWDVATNTLHLESAEMLAQHTRFALIVTNGIRDADGDPVQASPEFRRFRQTVHGEYKRELLDAIHVARRLGVRERDIVTASVFTTQSATAVLEKIRDQIKAATPEPADFLLGPKGERTVFPFRQVTSILWRQQREVEPPVFNPVNLDLSLFQLYPGSVGQLAFGKYLSPDYEVHTIPMIRPGEYIPAVGTRTGTPAVQSVNELYFNLVLPSSPRPPEGWPVAIFGHGNPGNKNSQLLLVGASLATRGIASIGINTVGNAFGPLGTLSVNRTAGEPVTFLEGGRGRDQDGNNVIGQQEGLAATLSRRIIVNRDGQRQIAADLMQLVRVLQVGMDVDGDGSTDLDPSRISYMGVSFGGMYGTQFVAVEPDVGAGYLASTGESSLDWSRLSSVNRPGQGNLLAARTPSLINAPGISVLDGVPIGPARFHENVPLRNGLPLAVTLADGTNLVIQSPVVNNVAGAMALQAAFENRDWVSMAGNSAAYAPHLRRAPLPGMSAKSVIYLFGKGDQTVTNPATTRLLRAGELRDRAMYYRHDLAYAEEPRLPRNPHGAGGAVGSQIPLEAAIARGINAQVQAFLASGGTEIICPEPARFFECPIQGPLPEDLNYIP